MPRTPWYVRTAAPVLTSCMLGVMASCAPGSASPPEPPGDPAAALAATMTDVELVGQVLMPYLYGGHATEVPGDVAEANQAYAGVATPAELVSRYQVGGVILFRRAEASGQVTADSNVVGPAQVRELVSGLQHAAATGDAAAAGASGLPLLVGIDQEYGVVRRLIEGVTALPSAMAFGAAGDTRLTGEAWRVAGTELAALGVNVNFAPVADVVADGGDVIGSRSFGSDPALVSAQVAAAVRGLQDAGVAATLKHFPGHGHTDVDSHTALPVLAASPQVLADRDLPPFVAGIAAGAGLVMSGHLDVAAVDPGVPATFSRAVMTDLLRGQLGFTGVAVTDALNMAPAQQWPPGEAAVRALLAGNDLLLMPPDLAAAQGGLLSALADGRLPRARLVEAVTRVLRLKLSLTGSPAPDLSVVDSAAHHAAVAPLAGAAVTLLRGRCDGSALVAGPVTVTAAAGREPARRGLAEALAVAGVPVVASGGAVVHLVGYGDGVADLAAGAAVTVAMDSPHLLEHADSPVLLATYSSSALSLDALAAVLAGTVPAAGRSPVPVPGLPRSACDP